MSDDFLGSFKGAGVIGTFLGAFVLIGFVFMSILVFDPRFGGGWESDRGAVSRQAKELDRLEAESIKLREKVDIQKEREDAARTLRKIQDKNTSLSAKVEAMSRSVADARSAIELLEADLRTYVAKVRAAAVGEVMQDLEMLDGKTYSNPTIIEVTAAGLHLRHRDGTARAMFVNLPASIQQRFRYDPEEMAAFLDEERRGTQAQEAKLDGEISAISAVKREEQIEFLQERNSFLESRIAASRERMEAIRFRPSAALWTLQKREADDRDELKTNTAELRRLGVDFDERKPR